MPGRIVGQELDDGDLGAEPAPDGAELEADDAAADDDEVLRDFGDRERADVGEDALLVELEEGELDRYGAGGNDDVLCLVGGDLFAGGPPAPTLHLDDVPRLAASPRPFAHVILFFRNRNSMPFVFCADDVVLPLQHRREVERQRRRSPMPCAAAACCRELVVLGRREQRLGRNAADVDARAAERLVHLDADGGEAELRGANRGDVAAGSAADDDDVSGIGGIAVRGFHIETKMPAGSVRGGRRISRSASWPDPPSAPSRARGRAPPAGRR